ncbi:arsenate reductase ArsC [Methylobacterium nigriterrae]|uniref:arsenate reductase ArsC n=1 Tax=Methylobacterium nigriterrae TaxID=3127512 RepID=UPI0030132D02
MAHHTYNVLFLSARNSVRSILAEAILRKEGQGRFEVFSAGIQPTPSLNPLTLQVLQEAEYPTDGLHPKSRSDFLDPSAPAMDFVFTLCDKAGGEAPPQWPGQPITADWSIEDPSAVGGTELQQKAAFITAQRYLKNRIVAFVALPITSLDQVSLTSRVRDIGQKS